MEPGRFRAWSAVREAWTLLAGNKRVYVAMSLTVWAVILVVRAALALALPERRAAAGGAGSGLIDIRFGWGFAIDVLGFEVFPGGAPLTPWPALETFVPILVSAAFAGAFAAFALRRSVGMGVEYRMLFRYGRYVPSLIGVAVLPMLFSALAGTAPLLLLPMMDLGGPAPVWLIVAVLPGLVFGVLIAMAAMFANLYVVDRDLGPLRAIGRSLTLAYSNFWQTAAFVLLGLVANLAFAFTLGLSGIWLAPMLAIAQACAFRDAVGVYTAGEHLPLGSLPSTGALSSVEHDSPGPALSSGA